MTGRNVTLAWPCTKTRSAYRYVSDKAEAEAKRSGATGFTLKDTQRYCTPAQPVCNIQPEPGRSAPLRSRFCLVFVQSLGLLLAFALSSCAPLQPPSADAPRGEAVYPFVITEDPGRRQVALAAASQLFQPASANGPTLQPVTATIRSLPPGFNLHLPKLGTAAVMTEEETRESLRRFLREWSGLIGSDPARLSLVERVDSPDGSKIANYEHRPFRYPIRGPYGKVNIRFGTDRRVLSLSSTSIPDAERLQPAIAAMTPKLTAEDATARIREKGVTYQNENGTQSTLQISPASEVNARDLVLYILPSRTNANILEFHLAWEVEVGGAAARKIYVDSITGDVVAVE